MLRVSQNPIPELNHPPYPETFSEIQIATGRTPNPLFSTTVDVLDLDRIANREPDRAGGDSATAPITLAPQTASSLVRSPLELTGSSFSTPIAQAELPPPASPSTNEPILSGASAAQAESKPVSDPGASDPGASDPGASEASDPPAPSAASDPDSALPESSQANRWRFSVEPYFFVPLGVEADVTVAGRSASLDLDLGDVLNLDRAFDAGLRLEGQYNRFGFILDGFYVSAADSGTVGVTFPEGSLQQRFGIPFAVRLDADASISIREFTLDTAVSYRVVDGALNNSTYPRFVVAPIAGLRTKFLWQKLEVDTVRVGNLSRSLDREFRSSRTTIEPLLGAQIAVDLSDRWAINFRGDISGFNLNADQDFTWNLLLGAQYRISPALSLQLAYRFSGFDFEDGEGIRRTRLNLYQNGITLSGLFRF